MLHVPLLTLSVLPCWTVPVITGGTPGAGGADSTGPTLALVAELCPESLDAVTVTVRDWPRSAADSVIVLPD